MIGAPSGAVQVNVSFYGQTETQRLKRKKKHLEAERRLMSK